jgi:hypothetical protein
MAGYFGNKGTHLRTALNINEFLGGTTLRPYRHCPPATPSTRARRWATSMSGKAVVTPNTTLRITATRHLAHNIEFQASYPFSKSVDFNSLPSTLKPVRSIYSTAP